MRQSKDGPFKLRKSLDLGEKKGKTPERVLIEEDKKPKSKVNELLLKTEPVSRQSPIIVFRFNLVSLKISINNRVD